MQEVLTLFVIMALGSLKPNASGL